jgi:hypothetical protein
MNELSAVRVLHAFAESQLTGNDMCDETSYLGIRWILEGGEHRETNEAVRHDGGPISIE